MHFRTQPTELHEANRRRLEQFWLDQKVANGVIRRAELPKRLYRYRSAETAFFTDELTRLLKSGDAYFPSQSHLNDPLDCLPTISYRVTFGEFRREIWPVLKDVSVFSAKSRYADGRITKDQLDSYIHFLKRHDIPTVLKIYRSMLDETALFDRMFGRVGILSLSLAFDNMVMWSMYANRGKGICIEFQIPEAPLDQGLAKVTYTNSRPIFDHYGYLSLVVGNMPAYALYGKKSHVNRILKGVDQTEFMNVKSEKWSYEEEYRLHTFAYKDEYTSLSPIKVSSVLIGFGLDQDRVRQIAELASRYDVPTKQVKLSLDGYGVMLAEVPSS